jgi:ABC-type transporter Mla subunit MlaD
MRGIGGPVTERKENKMASLKDVEQVADDLSNLVDQLRKEIRDNASFEKLMQLADEISEHADEAAGTFSTVNEALMSRLSELKSSGSNSTSSSASGGGSRSSRAKARS